MSDFSIGLDGSDSEPDQDGQVSDSLANPFLAKIPENDRPIVEKYIKDWDAGVTRRFQQIHEQYRPYKDLGYEPDQIQEAFALQQMINEDPQRVYELLGGILNPDEGQEQVQQSFGEDLPPAFVDKMTRMEQMMEQLASRFLEQEEQQQTEQEDAQLNQYLDQLKSQLGDFDEDWVLAKMLKGMDGEEAVRQYFAFVQQQINSRMSGRRPVPVLGGGGAVPHSGVDPSKLTRTQTQEYVAQMLANAAGQQ